VTGAHIPIIPGTSEFCFLIVILISRLFSAVYSQDLKWRGGNVIPVQHVSGRGSTRPGYYTGLFFLSIFLLCLECCLYSTN